MRVSVRTGGRDSKKAQVLRHLRPFLSRTPGSERATIPPFNHQDLHFLLLPPPRGGSSFRRVLPPPMSLFTPARVLVPFIRPCPPPERRQTGRNVEGYQESSPRVCAQPRSRAASRTRPARLKEQKRRHATLAHTRGLLTPHQPCRRARSGGACSTCSCRERPHWPNGKGDLWPPEGPRTGGPSNLRQEDLLKRRRSASPSLAINSLAINSLAIPHVPTCIPHVIGALEYWSIGVLEYL